MIKYLPKDKTGISDLTTTRGDDDTGIVFCYTNTEILNLCYEVSQNMGNLIIDGNGNSLIDDIVMDENRPSDTLKEKLIKKGWSDISSLMLKIYNDKLKNLHKVEDDNIYIPVISNSLCGDNVLNVVDDAIKDVLVYGIVSSWFADVNNEALKTMSLTEYNDVLSKLVRAIRNMESALLRKTINSPIFDSMI